MQHKIYLYVQNFETGGVHFGEGVLDFLEELKKNLALGYRLFQDYINTITRGAILGKFFLCCYWC